MGKHAKGKSPLSALVPSELAIAIEKWIQRHPGYTRTDFAIKALSVKLRMYGIVVKGSDLDQTLERRAPAKPRKSARSIKGKARILVTAWMDQRILEQLDVWRQKVRPPMTRTTFFLESIAELLCEEDLISRELATRNGAYAEYTHATKEFAKLIDMGEHAGESDAGRPIEDLPKWELVARGRKLLAQLVAILDALEHSPPVPPATNQGSPRQPG